MPTGASGGASTTAPVIEAGNPRRLAIARNCPIYTWIFLGRSLHSGAQQSVAGFGCGGQWDACAPMPMRPDHCRLTGPVAPRCAELRTLSATPRGGWCVRSTASLTVSPSATPASSGSRAAGKSVTALAISAGWGCRARPAELIDGLRFVRRPGYAEPGDDAALRDLGGDRIRHGVPGDHESPTRPTDRRAEHFVERRSAPTDQVGRAAAEGSAVELVARVGIPAPSNRIDDIPPAVGRNAPSAP